MDFSNNNSGYSKAEVNEFVDYVIKKTEDNILTIKKQKEEIEYLRKENSELKANYSNNYGNATEKLANDIKETARYEADLIIREAKDNASRIVNDALLKSQGLEKERERLIHNMKVYKRRLRNAMREHLDSLEDIEIL